MCFYWQNNLFGSFAESSDFVWLSAFLQQWAPLVNGYAESIVTVLITYERYILTCRPYETDTLLSLRRRQIIYGAAVFLPLLLSSAHAIHFLISYSVSNQHSSCDH